MILLLFVASLVVNVCIGAFLAGLMYDRRQWITKQSETYAELKIANDRLYAAWKEEYKIPEASQVVDAPDEALEPFIPELVEEVESWESPEAKASQTRWIRSQLALGKTQMEVWNALKEKR